MESEAYEACCAHFHEVYLHAPQLVVRAPGRVNLIGGHVDYNDGLVLPMAIDRAIWIAVRPNETDSFHVTSTLPEAQDIQFTAETLETPAGPAWGNYVRGVLAGFADRCALPERPGFDAVVHSSIPTGAGLSSSAALAIAVATLAEELYQHDLQPWDKVLLCQTAEHQYAGVPCGILDPFASLFGEAGALLALDCRSRDFYPVPLAPEVGVLIINSNVSHNLTDGAYAKRRGECESAARKLGLTSLRDADTARLSRCQPPAGPLTDTEYRRALHVVGENDRTRRMITALKSRDWITAGQQLFDAHTSISNNFEVSTLELDLLVELARELGPESGVYGARMTGGGFGGCTVNLVRTDSWPTVANHLTSAYKGQTGIIPSALWTRPAAGAGLYTAKP